jgi:glycosyltransferase involved in cell wall biosynthesis
MKAAVVDDIARTRQQSSGDKVSSPPFSLPLVSVIIVNYNYGRFLQQAADSVFEQTYPNIEFIIVDNASTDESADVLLPSQNNIRPRQSCGETTMAVKASPLKRASRQVRANMPFSSTPTIFCLHPVSQPMFSFIFRCAYPWGFPRPT